MTATPAKKKRTRLSREARFDALVELGLDLLSEQDFRILTISDICREAGISKPLFHHYFDGRDGYFLAVLRHAVAKLEEVTAPPETGPTFDGLIDVMERYLDFVRHHRAGAVIALRHGAGLGEEIEEIFTPLRERTYDLVRFLLGAELVTQEVSLAIRGWIGLNETVAFSLLTDSDVATRDAARFLSRSLFGLIEAALATAGEAMPPAWAELRRAAFASEGGG